MAYPTEYKYTKEHEWAKNEGGIVTVGITDHAQSSLGDVVFTDLPKVGTEIKIGQTFGVVESIKAVSDLYAPITGTVTEVNDTVVQDPSILNREPHTTGWMVKIKASNPSEFEGLLDKGQYETLIKSL
jgi:glycine cleavage system H protein